jgi:hypothetical protein
MKTQTQKKKCSQCLNEIPLYHYGVDTSSKDSYNNTCKACRNIKRKFNYKPTSINLNQLPLKLRNKEILKNIQGSSSFETIGCHTLTITKKPNEFEVRIRIEGDLVLGLDICGNDLIHLRDTITYHLENLKLTLIHVDQRT